MTHANHTPGLIAGDATLTSAEQDALRALVRLIVPASDEYKVPGADDDLIFADILTTLRPQAQHVSRALAQLDALAEGAFVRLTPAEQALVGERFRTAGSPGPGAIVGVVAQCYYRDDRVMESLGMGARPPFPKGYEVEEGDWSLLDPVRARPKLYRDAP